jgi:hypothetical protein
VGATVEARTLATIEVRALPEPQMVSISGLIGMAWLLAVQPRFRTRRTVDAAA